MAFHCCSGEGKFGRRGADVSLRDCLVDFLSVFLVGRAGVRKESCSSEMEGWRKEEELEEKVEDDRDEVERESLLDFLMEEKESVVSGQEKETSSSSCSSSLSLTTSLAQCVPSIPRLLPPSLGTDSQPWRRRNTHT